VDESKRPTGSLLEIWLAIQEEADAFWREPLEPQGASECVGLPHGELPQSCLEKKAVLAYESILESPPAEILEKSKSRLIH
jgi:hypothetical protein